MTRTVKGMSRRVNHGEGALPDPVRTTARSGELDRTDHRLETDPGGLRGDSRRLPRNRPTDVIRRKPDEPGRIALAAEISEEGRRVQLDEVVAGIGLKTRQLRQVQGLSLQQLADRSGVSPASIQKIERNSMVPTITTLMKLARALDRSVSYLIDEERDLSSSAVLVRATGRETLLGSRAGIRMENVAGPYGKFGLTGAFVTVESGADSGPRALAYGGEELVYVLGGALEFEIDQLFVVRRGDCLHLQSDRPHRWRNTGTAPAKALWVALPAR